MPTSSYCEPHSAKRCITCGLDLRVRQPGDLRRDMCIHCEEMVVEMFGVGCWLDVDDAEVLAFFDRKYGAPRPLERTRASSSGGA